MLSNTSFIHASVGIGLLLASVACAPTASIQPDAVQPQALTGPPSVSAAEHLAPVLLPVADDSTISYNIWIAVGSQDDPPGKEGLATLTAAMLTEGGTLTNSYEDVVKKLYPMAAGYSSSVDREMTTIRGRTHHETADQFQALLADSLTRPRFDAQDFERLRSDALNYLEKSLRYASDEELGKAALYEFVFAGTPYAHPSIGTVEGLRAITLDDVEQFYASHVTRDRVVFGLGGGFDQDRVTDLEATRALLPAGPAAPRVVTQRPEPFEGVHVKLVQKPGADASISAGYPIDVHRGEKDFYALWIANSWLGEHRNSTSHLYQVIREARGLNYGDYSYIEAFTGGGYRTMPPTNVGRRQQLFEIWVRTLPNEHAHFALRSAIRELALLVENGLTQEQFELQRSFLRKYVLHFADTTSARLGYAVDDRFYGLDESHLDRFRRMMDELTLADVNAAIKRHLHYQNIKVAIVTGEAEKLAAAIGSDAPSPMTYESEKPASVLEEDKLISTYRLNVRPEDIQTMLVDQIFQR